MNRVKTLRLICFLGKLKRIYSFTYIHKERSIKKNMRREIERKFYESCNRFCHSASASFVIIKKRHQT